VRPCVHALNHQIQRFVFTQCSSSLALHGRRRSVIGSGATPVITSMAGVYTSLTALHSSCHGTLLQVVPWPLKLLCMF
jgi:hypothetical protein